MSSKVHDDEDQPTKMEDILKSIRNIIDDKDKIASCFTTATKSTAMEEGDNKQEKELVLELTNIVNEEEINLISDSVKKHTEDEINKLRSVLNDLDKNKQLELPVKNLILPFIKHWLNINLPNIVKKVVAEEIKKIVPKS